MINRTLKKQILKDLSQKMVFVAGPRQCGKTTLALEILGSNKNRYLNWDDPEAREKIIKGNFPAKKGLIVLDEIHKYPKWRDSLKGLYDMRKQDIQILVTGSARLDYYRRGGESLQGRYHLLRMHPLTFKEISGSSQAELMNLFDLGGFPEPYFSGSKTEARRWSRENRTRVLYEDLVSLEKVKETTQIETLAIRLPELVGSTLSINSLREDLSVSHVTVQNWLQIMENLYYIYRILPFGSSKIKAVKKETKHYHYDWNSIDEPGARFENMIANHLLKYCQYQEDTEGHTTELRFFRDRERREVDFVITQNKKPMLFVECKLKQEDSPPMLKYLKQKFEAVPTVLVSLRESEDYIDKHNIRHCDAKTFLSELI